MHSHFKPVNLPPSLSPGLRDILKKALEFNPEDRFSSIDEFSQAVLNYARNSLRAGQVPSIRPIIEPNPIVTDGLRPNQEKKPSGLPTKPHQPKRFPTYLYWILGGALLIIIPALFLNRTNLSSSMISAAIPSPTSVMNATPEITMEATNTSVPTATMTLEPTVESITTRLRKIDGMEQVVIPAGTFRMGSDYEEEREKPEHTVWLDTYWIDTYEVTNSQYAMCVSAGACNSPDYRNSLTQDKYYGNNNFANYPVLFVSWYDASDYCGWVGGRLPTEAEWEKAARGDQDARNFPWGDHFGSNYANLCDRNCTMSWKNTNYDDGFIDTSPVTDFPDGVSPYGAMNMAGNVCEWVADWYKSDYFYSKLDWNEPTGPSSGTTRVIKGGSWYDDTDILRVSARYGFDPNKSYYDVGFRCVNEP